MTKFEGIRENSVGGWTGTLYAVGIDIGGTKVAVGVVDESGRVQTKKTLPTDTKGPPQEMIRRVSRTIHRLLEEAGLSLGQMAGIGIGAPGPLDIKKGWLTCPPNLPHWVDVPIVEEFQTRFSLPVVLDNDANAAALAEKWRGSAQDSNHFIFITISTGIGAGLFFDGKLVAGSRGNAGDIGHMVVNPSFGICSCGQKGCLEWIASGTAIARRGSEILGKKLTTQEIFQFYHQGHPGIRRLVEEAFTAIGVGCVTLINAFDPEKIVIGGGVSQVGEPLFAAVRQYVQTYALNPAARQTPIVPATLQQDAGVIGAAALILLPFIQGKMQNP